MQIHDDGNILLEKAAMRGAFVERQRDRIGLALWRPVHFHSTQPDFGMVGVERDAGAARGGEDASPIWIGAGNRGLHQRRAGNRLRDLLGGAVARSAAHFDFDDVRRAFAIGYNPERKRVANFFERTNKFRIIAAPRLRDCSRARGAIREHKQRVIGGTVAIDGNAVERARDNFAQRAIEDARRDGRVGEDKREHRRHVRMNHPGALSATRNAHGTSANFAVCGGALRTRIGGHDGARESVESARRECERRSQARSSF